MSSAGIVPWNKMNVIREAMIIIDLIVLSIYPCQCHICASIGIISAILAGGSGGLWAYKAEFQRLKQRMGWKGYRKRQDENETKSIEIVTIQSSSSGIEIGVEVETE